MKTLIIVRHAKSSWDVAVQSDHERTLNQRGLQDAPRIAELIAKRYPVLDAIVSSTAVRALTTARFMAEGYGPPQTALTTTARIYEADVAGLLNVIDELNPNYNAVMLVGHNPGVTELVRYLADRTFSHMSTCNVAVITFPQAGTWNEIGKETGVLTEVLRPH